MKASELISKLQEAEGDPVVLLADHDRGYRYDAKTVSANTYGEENFYGNFTYLPVSEKDEKAFRAVIID